MAKGFPGGVVGYDQSDRCHLLLKDLVPSAKIYTRFTVLRPNSWMMFESATMIVGSVQMRGNCRWNP